MASEDAETRTEVVDEKPPVSITVSEREHIRPALILHLCHRNNRMRDDDESCLHFFTVRALLNAPF